MTNTGMTTMGEVADRVAHHSKNCHDAMTPVDQIRFLSLDTVRIEKVNLFGLWRLVELQRRG